MNAATRPRRVCPLCSTRTSDWNCCGIYLGGRRRRWSMTPANIKLVHVVKARKGLDEETYRLRLQAVGVASCKDLSHGQFIAFLEGLSKLPDAPTWRPRAQASGSTTRRARG